MTPPTATATDLTQILGTVKEQVDSYNQERQQLAASLREIVAQANQLLSQLGEAVSAPGRRGRPAGTGRKRGRPAGSKNKSKGARKGRRKMSAAARKAISDAQKKRWAKQKGAEK